MFAVWFTCHAHLQLRRRMQADSEDIFGPTLVQPRLRLPRRPWFLQRLELHGVEAHWRTGASDDISPALQGLLRVRPHRAWSGPLTTFSAEADLLWMYEGCPCNSYAAEIIECLFFQKAVGVVCAEGGRRENALRSSQHGSPFVPSRDVVETALQERLFDLRGVCRGRASDILRGWGGQATGMPCISVVEPVMQLVRRGAWRELIFLSGVTGWRRHVDPSLPADFAPSLRPVGFYKPHNPQDLTPEWITDHVTCLRQWAPSILQQHPDVRGLLEEHVATLTCVASRLRGGSEALDTIRGAAVGPGGQAQVAAMTEELEYRAFAAWIWRHALDMLSGK